MQRERAQAALAAIEGSIGRRSTFVTLFVGRFVGRFVAAGAAFAVAMTRSVTRPLGQATDAAARIADGALAVRISPQGSDEAAQLLRSLQVMAQQLSGMVSSVRQSAESIDTASREITQGSTCRRAPSCSPLRCRRLRPRSASSPAWWPATATTP